jgi:cytochrome c-type biogenesis protein CcmF
MRTEMEIAEILLFGAAVLIFGDLVQLFNSKNGRASKKRGTQRMEIPMNPIGCLLIIGSYLLLAQAFIVNNFRFQEVYFYSSSGLPILGRLYASWASSAGSWLFLAATFALGYLIIRFFLRDREHSFRAFQALDIMLLFIILVVFLKSPFLTFSEVQMDGRGLNPLLKTPWMLIHPPVVFIGYVLTFYSFAFTIDTFRKENRTASYLVRLFAQSSWLFLTLGIALGGLWAYEVLGWGGYWAWDPVETASLVPWITLTAFFHLTSSISGRESSSREVMVLVSSALVVFATAITRGGLAESVHAFGASSIGFVLLALMVLKGGYFLYYKRKGSRPFFDFNFDTDSVHSTAMSLSFISLILIALVCLWGLIFPMIGSLMGGGNVSVDAAFFNKWCYPFVLIFLASLIGCHLSSKLNMKTYAGLLGGLLVLGVIFGFLDFPTTNMLANLGIPFSLFALGAVIYSTFERLLRGSRSSVLISRNLIHLGVVLVVLGILLSSPAVMDYGELVVNPASTLELDDISIKFGDVVIREPFGNIHDPSTESFHNPEAAGLRLPVTLTKGGSRLTGELDILLYTLHGVVSRPLILRSPDLDVYMVLLQTEDVYYSLVHVMLDMPIPPSSFVVNIKTFPLMNLIWLGVALMSVGIVFPLLWVRRI